MLRCLGIFTSLCFLVPSIPVHAQATKDLKTKSVDLKPYEKFAEQFTGWVKNGEAKKIVAAIDVAAVFERSLKGSGFDDDIKKRMIAGGQSSIEVFPTVLIKAVEKDGSYKLLRIRVVDGEVRALFRMLSGGGLNYHDLALQTRADGTVVIADIYIALAGEFLSQTIKRLVLQAFALDPKKIKEGVPPAVLDAVQRMQKISRMCRNEQFREALAEWDKLPDAMKKEKGVFLLRFLAASGLMDIDPEGYQKVMSDFQTLFPNDPAGELIQIDGLFFRKKFLELQQALNRIDKGVGGDPYLDVVRCIVYTEDKKFAEAKSAGERAVKAEPDLQPAYEALLSSSLKAKSYADTAKWLTELEKRFQVPADDVIKGDAFADFVQSAEYRQWKEKRK